MNVSCSQSEGYDEETRDLQGLLNVFASLCSLEDIASAYCSAKGNVDTAGEILVELLDTKHGNKGNIAHDGETSHSSVIESVEEDNVPVQKIQGFKYKRFTASTGIVSNAIGKSYALPHRYGVPSLKADGPLESETKKSNILSLSKFDHPSGDKTLNCKDVEDFLFSMLHDGFNLDKEKTQDILRSCGYDVKKSMEKLWELSNLKSTEGKEIESSDASTSSSSEESVHLHKNCADLTVTESVVNESCYEHPNGALAVLEALYGDSKVHQKEPKHARLELGRNRKRVPREKVVNVAPVAIEVKPTELKASRDMKVDKDEYGVLREAAKSHRDIMKAYYEKAFDVFTSGDREKANCLLEKGKYHNKLAREADEKSAKEITATRSAATKDIFSLDLHMHHTKEAVTLLKQHLRSLAGISSISHLKVVINSDGEDATKGRRKQAVIKLLQKQCILWKEEEGNSGTILIQMDIINPKKLSFT